MGTLCSKGEDGTRGPAQDEVADEALLQSRGQILSTYLYSKATAHFRHSYVQNNLNVSKLKQIPLHGFCSVLFYLAWKVRWWVRSASVFNRGSWWPCPCISWLSLSPKLLFSMCKITGSGKWLLMTNNGLNTTWNRGFRTISSETYWNWMYTIELAGQVHKCDDAFSISVYQWIPAIQSRYKRLEI